MRRTWFSTSIIEDGPVHALFLCRKHDFEGSAPTENAMDGDRSLTAKYNPPIVYLAEEIEALASGTGQLTPVIPYPARTRT